mmetsp:Transcript_14062/g.16294  ORF Transcript_14062/g.16294 Transcript_14062/m.16294 type:complete len:283 (+) Transcript_14062:1401-2249(+)
MNSWKITKRKRTCANSIRSIVFFMYFTYMFIQFLLSFVLVGAFYAAISTLLRTLLPHSECQDFTYAANALENIYLCMLFFVIMLSCTSKIEYTGEWFKFISIVMGLFTLILMGITFWRTYQTISFDDSNIILTLIMVGSLLSSYLIPLMLHFHDIKFGDFVKGVIYSIYLSPTMVNIISIYSMSNICDVSWGSRPASGGKESGVSNEEQKQKDQRDQSFKNFRAWFLVFWIIVNTITGFVIIWLNRSSQTNVLLYIGLGLTGLLVFKVFFALVHFVITIFEN